MMYGQAVMVMAADSVLFMPVTPVVAVIGMPVVPNRHYGAKVVPAAMVSLPCWFISAARMVHFFQDYGRVLHDQAIYGVKPEGKLSVEYTYESFSFPDGEKYELCKPTYTISEWYAEEIKPEDLFCTSASPCAM